MINLKDIEIRYRLNPEPQEVIDTRCNIETAFNDLKFIEDTHQYFVGDIEYPSVSSVCHKFEPYVDWDSIAEKKSQKLGISKEDLLKEWHETNISSTSCGSKTHWFGEQMMNLFIGREVQLPFQYTPDNYIIPYSPKEKAIEKYWTDILENSDVYPVMPEAKIYNRSLHYAGTFDILLAYRIKDHISFSIHDYKGLPIDTPIATKNGWKTMEDLSEDDYVYDKDCNLCKILHLSTIHFNPCYQIIFSSGDFIIADEDHKWLVTIFGGSRMILTTKELYPGVMIDKIDNPENPYHQSKKLVINEVRSTPTVPTRCIEVDSPSHTYLASRDFIVTHNTNKDLKNDFNRKKSNRLLEPFFDFIDEPLSLYSIQLSLYQLGLQQLGIPIVDRNLIWLKDDGSYEKIKTPDLTDRLLKIL